MSTLSPDTSVTAFPRFELKQRSSVRSVSDSPRSKISSAEELRALRFKVRHLEAQKSALKTQIHKLTGTLAETLLRNIASMRCG